MTIAPLPFVRALHDRYAVERELGAGGMATVYLARDLESSARVAVKVLRPELAPILGAERFAREIRITARLRHPNILPVLDAGEVAGLSYYVTPYIEGESLGKRLQRQRQLPIPEAIEIACQIAEALEVAHDQGFVHRDIKPSNILMEGDRAILADFGIARTIDVPTAEKLTESGIALGTPAYMSPEQAACEPIDARSDIYSLGCVLFEMLTGAPPFVGPNPQAVRARHAADPPPSIYTVRHTVPASLERVVRTALEKVPADRYPTTREFQSALRQVDLGEPGAPDRRPWHKRGAVRASAGVFVLTAAFLAWLTASASRGVEANRIMVYPLVVPPGLAASRTLGEDVATIIGHSLDGAGRLRWIDGWSALAPRHRADIRSLSQDEATAFARAMRCGYYISGRLAASGDSARIFLELTDVAGDSTVALGTASGSLAQAWTLGLRAINDILPELIPTGAPAAMNEWADRKPAAMASFLRGEAAFRRLRLGEALDHYRAAVEEDSLFGLAAVRGAQAATWRHRVNEAASLIRVATRQQMPPRYAHFARGYEAYLEGRADSAAAEFRRALELDPEMAVAWMQLGEVYTHLLPRAGDPQSLADSAFEEADRLDPQAGNLLFHLIEIRLRKGEVVSAQPLIEQLRAARPEPEIRDQIAIMEACALHGPSAVDWMAEARKGTLPVLAAGKLFAAAGARLECAEPALVAVIRADTTTAGASRWFALLQLQALLLAQGRVGEAMAHVDAMPPEEAANVMYLLDAPVFPAVAERAAESALQYKAECGPAYARCSNPYRVWQLGVWDAHRGRTVEAELASRELAARAKRDTTPRDARLADLLSRSVAAHAALARSDTGTAFGLLEALQSEAVPGGEDIEWDIGRPRGLDRLRFAQLLLARGEPERALEVADVLDSAAPSIYLLYLPESLRLRADAAAALGDQGRAMRYQARLAALRGAGVPGTTVRSKEDVT